MTARSSASALVLPRCCKYIFVVVCMHLALSVPAIRLVAIAPAGLALLISHAYLLGLVGLLLVAHFWVSLGLALLDMVLRFCLSGSIVHVLCHNDYSGSN
eukprot:scaffold1890_cov132-Skeletonema_marinoi.AAC.5